MDFVIGVVTAILGLTFVAVPWLFRLTGNNSLASTTIVAGGAIVTMLGVALALTASRASRPRRR